MGPFAPFVAWYKRSDATAFVHGCGRETFVNDSRYACPSPRSDEIVSLCSPVLLPRRTTRVLVSMQNDESDSTLHFMIRSTMHARLSSTYYFRRAHHLEPAHGPMPRPSLYPLPRCSSTPFRFTSHKTQHHPSLFRPSIRKRTYSRCVSRGRSAVAESVQIKTISPDLQSQSVIGTLVRYKPTIDGITTTLNRATPYPPGRFGARQARRGGGHGTAFRVHRSIQNAPLSA